MNEREQPERAEEDLEILEVVGLDGEAVPAAAAPTGDWATSAPAGAAMERPEHEAEELAEEQLLLRLRADYDNLRKRIDRERQEFELHANSRLISRLLPIVDNFERALAAGAKGENERSFREGCILIYKQLVDELRRQGLQAIDTEGRRFDPELHDAVATDATSSEPHNTVVEELRRGYLFRNRLLRPAMVKVSTGGNGNGESGQT